MDAEQGPSSQDVIRSLSCQGGAACCRERPLPAAVCGRPLGPAFSNKDSIPEAKAHSFITKMLPVTFCTLHPLRFFVLLLICKRQSREPILIKCEFNKCLLGTSYFKVVPAWAQMTQHASELLSAWTFSQCSVGGRGRGGGERDRDRAQQPK